MNEPPSQPPLMPAAGASQSQYGGMPPVQKTNGMSIASLVSGILGLTLCPGLGSLLALIFGYVGRGQIKRSEGREGGNGFAVAGLVMGWIGMVLVVATIAAMALGAIALFNFAGSDGFQDIVEEGGAAILEDTLTEVAPAEAGCTPIETYPDMGAAHIQPGQSHKPYNSNPPTSGPHYAVPADPGFYEDTSTVEPEQLVHNLEHGQIVIWYRPTVNGLVEEQVEQLVSQEPRATVGAPFPDMNEPYNIVLTSWTRARACEQASQEVVDSFRRRFQGRSPEPITPRFKG